MQPVLQSCVSAATSCEDTADGSGVLLGSVVLIVAVAIALIAVGLRRSRRSHD